MRLKTQVRLKSEIKEQQKIFSKNSFSDQSSDLVSIFTFFLPIVQSLKFGGVQFPRAIEVTGQFLGGLSKRVRVSRPFCHLKRRRPLTQLDVRAVACKNQCVVNISVQLSESPKSNGEAPVYIA